MSYLILYKPLYSKSTTKFLFRINLQFVTSLSNRTINSPVCQQILETCYVELL